MCPYRDNGHLTERQKNFNVVLSSTRVVIEQAFGLLKGRFRRLKYLDMSDLTLVSHVITTACILHNICIDNNDEIDCGVLVNTCSESVYDDSSTTTLERNNGFVKVTSLHLH